MIPNVRVQNFVADRDATKLMKLASISVPRLFACVAFLFSVLAVGAEDKKVDPTGTWVWTVQGRGGQGEPREMTLKIKKEGEKYVGAISGGRGGETKIESVKVEGDQISFDVTREFNGNSFTSKYSGKVTDDAITGKIDFKTRDGETRSRDWVVKRKKDEAKKDA
jgi:hypothetical protein